MSMLSCPLCGRQVSRRLFAPEDLEEDIQVVERVSLGRARGFKVVGRPSVLDDKVLMGRIAARCHVILKLLGQDQDIDEEKLQGLIDEYEEIWEDCLIRINSALPEYEDFDDLEDAVKTLVKEYFEAQVEDDLVEV